MLHNVLLYDVYDIDDTLFRSRKRKFEVLKILGSAVSYEESLTRSVEKREFGDIDYVKFYRLFDSPAYLEFDEPLEGAVEVLNGMRNGSRGVVYVTNRHGFGDDSMRKGTIESLEKSGFPVPDGKEVYLLMKAEKGLDRRTSKLTLVTAAVEFLNGRVKLGFGDLPEDAEIYMKAGLVPMIIRHPKLNNSEYPPGSNVFESWKEIGESGLLVPE